ncbi:MAG: hypothetical protein AAB486_00435 [Patescibacteria group bacterium]
MRATTAATTRPDYLPPASFYDDSMVQTKTKVDATMALDTAWQCYRGIWQPAAVDTHKIAYVHIDDQYCFMDDGELPVPGSYGDIMAETHLTYRLGGKVKTHVLTGDQHPPLAIYFPEWWFAGKDWTDDYGHKYRRGERPLDNTLIPLEAIDDGRWVARFETAWSHSYPARLKADGRQPLMVWAHHGHEGTHSANIVAVLMEAILVCSYGRMTKPIFIGKGRSSVSEHFSPLEYEVPIPGVPQLNERQLQVLEEHDEIWISGRALSHCEMAYVRTLVKYFGVKDPGVLKRVKILMDTTHSVVVPGIDFHGIALQQFEDWRKQYGIELLNSTDLD